eukprot:5481550-Prymnesium_polylepis.1
MARSSTRRCGHFMARRPHALLATDACTASTLLSPDRPHALLLRGGCHRQQWSGGPRAAIASSC